ncbi:hypothetical protein LMG7974_01943 [Campylobacter majalis]|uniref:Uncharacterized protein n=1 Tax=Campylobacter majalis TaxID=2790656 RepID=A0ABN7KCR5_9BACT|nr:hypothetical protein [Campylobacter majalis]CAD7289857.1 hypothetical protein LMG7974_01943 [Campylobacter majalis]
MENQKSEQCLYLDDFTIIINFEARIVKLISDNLDDDILFRQFENSKIVKKEASTIGYYCYFDHKTTLEKSKNNGFIGNVNLIYADKIIGGAMVFLENGLLKMLECYLWEENSFFENMVNIK